MTIYENINRLTAYALKTSLIAKEDVIYTQNKLLELFRLDGFEADENDTNPDKFQVLPEVEVSDLENILNEMMDYASANNLFEDSGTTARDLFDTKIMGQLVPPPSDVIDIFNTLKSEVGSEEATNWYYKFSGDTNYIRRQRIAKDVKWQTSTEYGDLDITINLSKPEKDPKAIAAAKNMKQSGYPSCLLCKENEGYAGRMNHAARQNHRIIPLTLNEEKWFLQYSPYVYYNEHCIVFSSSHTPMKIEEATFKRLLDFVQIFPHYTLGSNADIPIVGGSILTHNHFQGGRYSFPMEKAPIQKSYRLKMYPNVKAGIVKWPMSVIRLDSKFIPDLVKAATHILNCWKEYSDQNAFIFAETNGEPHNTITPIARKRGNMYELDLVLRNNITTEEHPLGVYHPHAELHHIKKENIGLIEVMGLAVLPSRLKDELSKLEEAMLDNADISNDEILGKHADWAKEILAKHSDFNKTNAAKILQDETGLVFSKVLEDAGVYKQTADGQKAFEKFIDKVNEYTGNV